MQFFSDFLFNHLIFRLEGVSPGEQKYESFQSASSACEKKTGNFRCPVCRAAFLFIQQAHA
jgi:hypothetical protein